MKRSHHVSFAVSDLERARRFYGQVLGLPEIPRPDFGVAGTWYRLGESELHLIVPPAGVRVGATPERLTPVADHAAFEIDDYDAAVAHLRAHGVEFLETRREIGQIFARDPDGHVIELIVPGGRLGRSA